MSKKCCITVSYLTLADHGVMDSLVQQSECSCAYTSSFHNMYRLYILTELFEKVYQPEGKA